VTQVVCGKYCDGCPLQGERPRQTEGEPKQGAFFFITEAPGEKQYSRNHFLSHRAQELIEQALQFVRLDSRDVYMTPVIKCGHDPDKFTAKERRAIFQHCTQYLEDEMKEARPEVIIPLGGNAASFVANRAVKITKVRGVPYRDEIGRLILPMLNPNQVILYPQYQSTFKSDFATLARLIDYDYDIESSSDASRGQYKYIEDLTFLINQNPHTVAFDTETSGLRWYEPGFKILSMQFSIRPGEAYTLVWDHPERPRSRQEKAKLKEQLKKLLCHPRVKVVGQNLKFDTVGLYTQTGLRLRIGGDTLMLAALLDENAVTKNLDDLIKRHVPAMAGYADQFNKNVDKSRMAEQPLDKQYLDYSAGDADAALRLYRALIEIVERDKRLFAHYHYVSLPGLNAFASLETRGMDIDEGNIETFEQHMKESVEQQYKALLRQVPKSIKRLHIDKGLKFSRKDFLLDILFRHPDGFQLKPKVFTKTTSRYEDKSKKVPSTSSKDHLPYFFETCPFTQQLAEYIKDERLLNTNVVGFKNKYIRDGKVRPSYRLDKTVTGRSSSEDPNGQNYPKRGKNAKAYRKLFVAPEGCYIIEADLSQAELRISGDMANDPTMLQIYQDEGDIHTETALIVMGITLEQLRKLTKEEQGLARFKAKAVNFGFIYGMGWRKFIGYAKTQYGVEFTEKEAQRIREAFFEKYYMLNDWHRQVRQFARLHKYVRSYSGRVRHLPMIDSEDEMIQQEAERQAINSPVQEFASSLGIMAIARLDMQIDPQYLKVVGFIHDAVVAIVPKQHVEWGAKTMKHYMESNKLEEWFGTRLKAPIIADVSFGINLGEANEMKGLKLGKVYDFEQFWDEKERKGIRVPKQVVPPNNGRRVAHLFTGYKIAA
jgi:uracil-DNA glycosylase family 4